MDGFGKDVRGVPEVRGIYHGSAIDNRHRATRCEVAYRDVGRLEVRPGELVSRRMKRRQHEHDLDAARAQLLDERGHGSGAGRRWGGVADVGEEPARRGDDPTVGVRAAWCDPVSEQRLVVALARRERAEPLLEQKTLAVG